MKKATSSTLPLPPKDGSKWLPSPSKYPKGKRSRDPDALCGIERRRVKKTKLRFGELEVAADPILYILGTPSTLAFPPGSPNKMPFIPGNFTGPESGYPDVHVESRVQVPLCIIPTFIFSAYPNFRRRVRSRFVPFFWFLSTSSGTKRNMPERTLSSSTNVILASQNRCAPVSRSHTGSAHARSGHCNLHLPGENAVEDDGHSL